ncbi:MAG TPA: hypothetical protein VFY71_07425 [Planctomycetota bacterium]|nr:hypothetical protein [Planctomycetota bacterium]
MANIYDAQTGQTQQTAGVPDPRFKTAATASLAPAPAPAAAAPAPTPAPVATAAPTPNAPNGGQTPQGQPQPSQAPVAGVTLPNGQWVPNDHPLAQQAAGGGQAPGAAGGPPPNPMADAFRTALTARLQANPIPTSIADDPALAAQSGAFRQAQQRAADRSRSAGMEALSAQGLGSSGSAASMARKVDADRAMAEGAFDAGLLGDARKQNMAELFQAMGLYQQGDQYDRGLAEQVASRLAGQDIQRQGLAAQTRLGEGDLALRGELGRAGNQNQLLGLLLNNRYQNDTLGLNAGLAQQGINTNALLAMMGMGGS